jgi:hypothetical protein
LICAWRTRSEPDEASRRSTRSIASGAARAVVIPREQRADHAAQHSRVAARFGVLDRLLHLALGLTRRAATDDHEPVEPPRESKVTLVVQLFERRDRLAADLLSTLEIRAGA